MSAAEVECCLPIYYRIPALYSVAVVCKAFQCWTEAPTEAAAGCKASQCLSVAARYYRAIQDGTAAALAGVAAACRSC